MGHRTLLRPVSSRKWTRMPLRQLFSWSMLRPVMIRENFCQSCLEWTISSMSAFAGGSQVARTVWTSIFSYGIATVLVRRVKVRIAETVVVRRGTTVWVQQCAYSPACILHLAGHEHPLHRDPLAAWVLRLVLNSQQPCQRRVDVALENCFARVPVVQVLGAVCRRRRDGVIDVRDDVHFLVRVEADVLARVAGLEQGQRHIATRIDEQGPAECVSTQRGARSIT